VTEKLFTYALDRGVDSADAPTVRGLVRALAANDDHWSTLVLGIVQSPAVPDAAVHRPGPGHAVATSAAVR